MLVTARYTEAKCPIWRVH